MANTLIIEQCGTGGTSLGRFTRRGDVAWGEWSGDRTILTLVSVRTHEALAEIDLSRGIIRDGYDGTYVGKFTCFAAALRMALGAPCYGYSWYQVKGKPRSYEPSP